ncbi:MAG: hypothetical protein KatS3mg020_0914 [Fimbriimonadales bacterium]|nr:MAG: hypothetical protein KatS3mg020_0021 [Fimbriimonadales bacterium]GIV11026.1 MAG: hypothetical protein KatS3mg020_0517 [Fimbriimonadales bacterium]GIV11423.1 MAG: hypothetical protein KatS3mg020_0914 [Fimbriimonadales bacterium]
MNQRHTTMRYCEEDVVEFFKDLRAQVTYPIVHGDPLLIIYDLLCVLNVPERKIMDWFGSRGYMHVARNRIVEPRVFERALHAIMEDEHEEE